MTTSEKDAIVRKELKLVEVYLSNMRNTSGWRLPTIIALAASSRGSLRKASALIGYSGQRWRDLWLYLASILPLLIPVNLAFAATVFAALVTFVSGALSVVTMEPKVIEKTVTVPFLFFFRTTKTISETIMVPVVHFPHYAISQGAAALIILAAILSTSWLLKRAWLREIDFRRRRLEHHWESAITHTWKLGARLSTVPTM